MAVIKSLFGKSAEGKEISLYTLSNDQGMKAEITDLGATLVRVLVPDATGKADDLVLGFDNGESYYGNDSFFGTVIGPCANRTGGAEYLSLIHILIRRARSPRICVREGSFEGSRHTTEKFQIS